MLNIDEIRAVTDKATPGEWKVVGRGNTVPSLAIVNEFETGKIICSSISPKREADAKFISRARQWVPALCDEVEAGRAKIKELEKTLEKACEYLADNNASRIDWKEYFSKLAREEMEK